MSGDMILTVLGLITTAVVAFGVYRRGRKADAVTEQSGLAGNNRAGTAQIIDGLNQLVDQLQDDYKEARFDIKALVIRLDGITKERDDLRLELARLRHRYGDTNEH